MFQVVLKYDQDNEVWIFNGIEFQMNPPPHGVCHVPGTANLAGTGSVAPLSACP